MSNRQKTVTIIGDTSSFHLGSKTNYCAFRELVKSRYSVIQEIPYDAFGTEHISFLAFLNALKQSLWWSGITRSDILIVHGEGLTEKYADYVYPYLYFSHVAELLEKESWLVNFSMYEGEQFAELLSKFSYMACRDVLTQEHLRKLGFATTLSFDCSVLFMPVQSYSDSNGSIAVIRGRKKPDPHIIRQFHNITKYNACWQWPDKDAVSLPSFIAYTDRIRHAQGVLSTSFHGNILAYLSGVPFVSLDSSNEKYRAMEVELLPQRGKVGLDNIRYWQEVRQQVHKHFSSLYPSLVERAHNNIKHT